MSCIICVPKPCTDLLCFTVCNTPFSANIVPLYVFVIEIAKNDLYSKTFISMNGLLAFSAASIALSNRFDNNEDKSDKSILILGRLSKA